MFESQLECTVNELLKDKDPKKAQIDLELLGDLLVKLPYFKNLTETYSDMGPLMFINFLNHLKFMILEPNSIIWEYNDDVTGVYIIITGEVKIFKPPNKSTLVRRKRPIKNKLLFNEKKNNNKLASARIRKHIYKHLKNDSDKNLPLQKKNLLVGKNKNIKTERSFSCQFINSRINIKRNMENENTNNISNNYNFRNNKSLENIKEYGKEISLTEKNFWYREPLEKRKIDYIETFGQIIGEDCLIRKIYSRPYGAETLTKCYLGFLSSEEYHLIFDKINAINKTNIINFLYNVNYFNNKNNFLFKLYKTMKIKIFPKGSYIYKQNEPFKTMYLIKKGNVDINIMKIVKIKSNINSDIIVGEKNLKYKKSDNKNIQNNINKINDINEIEHFTSERIFELKGEYYEKKIYTLVNYGVGEVLGNIEYYGKLKNYICSAKCLSTVELYVIDINVYKSIESPDNIEFLNRKTNRQLNFLKKRIKEINLVLNKNNYDHYTSRNKFMKIIYARHPESPSIENSKYINNNKEPFPIKIKIKNKKLKNTKFYHFRNDEFNSLNINFDSIDNNKQIKSLNPFITNNKDFTILFNENNLNNTNNRYNIENKNNEYNKILLSSTLSNSHSKNNYRRKYNKNLFNYMKSHYKNKYKNLSLNKEEIEKIKLPKNKKLDFNTIIASKPSNNFNPLSTYLTSKYKSNEINYNIYDKNTINNNTLNTNNKINFRSVSSGLFTNPNLKFKINGSSPKMITTINNINNNNTNIYMIKDKSKRDLILNNEYLKKIDMGRIFSEQNQKLYQNKDNIRKKTIKINNEMGTTTIAFHGYRVFLPKKINEKRIRNMKRFNSYNLKNMLQFPNKNNVLKKDNEKIEDESNKSNDIKNSIIKTISRKKTVLNNLYRPIRLKSAKQ